MKRFLALLLSAMLILSTFSITVSAAVSPIDYSFDDDFEDGVYSQADIAEMLGATYADGSAFAFEVSNGMFTANSVGKGTDNFTLPIDQKFTEGTLELNARFKPDNPRDAGDNRIYIIAFSESGTGVQLLTIDSGGESFVKLAGDAMDNYNGAVPELTKDSDGFYNVSIGITDEVPENVTNPDNQSFYVTIKDMNAGGVQKVSYTIKKSVTDISSLRFHIYKSSGSISAGKNSAIIFDTLSFRKVLPKVVSVSAPEGNISPKIGTINVAFNTAVKIDTIADGITFENADGEAAPGLSITPAADKKSVAVKFDTLDVTTDYVLSINENLKADADGVAFKPYTVNYTPVVEPFAITSVSNEGGTVMPTIGTIEITFNNPIDEETLAEGITFLKDNGDPIPGGAVIRMGETSDKVEVLVGRVGKGSYVLSIKDTLKDAYDQTLENDVTYGYIVEESNPALLDVSFDEGLEDREYSYDEVESMTGGIFSDSSAFVLTGNADGLEINEPANGNQSIFKIMNSEVFETGEVTYNFVLKKVNKAGDGVGDNQFRINWVTSTGASPILTANVLYSQIKRPSGLQSWYSGDEASLTPDADGYLNFSCVITDELPVNRVTSKSKYIMYIYDNNKGGTDPVLTVVYNGDALSDIAGISFATYKNGAALPYENAINVKSIKATVNEDKIPNHVMSSDAEGVNPSLENVNLVFTNAFKNITANGVSVISGDKTVAMSADIFEDEKTITLTPADYLLYGTTYTVSFPAPLQVYEFTTEAYAERLSATTDGMLLNVSLVNNELDEYVIVATYKDAEGNKLSVKSAATSSRSAIIPIDGDAESVVVNAYKVVDGCYIKASLPVERSL